MLHCPKDGDAAIDVQNVPIFVWLRADRDDCKGIVPAVLPDTDSIADADSITIQLEALCAPDTTYVPVVPAMEELLTVAVVYTTFRFDGTPTMYIGSQSNALIMVRM